MYFGQWPKTVLAIIFLRAVVKRIEEADENGSKSEAEAGRRLGQRERPPQIPWGRQTVCRWVCCPWAPWRRPLPQPAWRQTAGDWSERMGWRTRTAPGGCLHSACMQTLARGSLCSTAARRAGRTSHLPCTPAVQKVMH